MRNEIRKFQFPMIKRNIEIEEKNKYIWTVNDAAEDTFLHKEVPVFLYDQYEKKEIHGLVKHMRKAMIDARGIGLSANQMGFGYRLFVAQLPAKDGKGYVGKFYTIINPVITSESPKKIADEEGCLSIPATYGTVERAEKVVLTGIDKNGRDVKIKAEGLLARIFQHEADHLNGILFTSKAKNIFTIDSKGQSNKL